MLRIRNMGGVSPLPFFICASSFKRRNHWKRHGTKNVLKWNRALGFEFSIQSSVYGVTFCCESKPILYLDTVYCKFLLYVCVEIDPCSCVEIDPYSCEQRSAV